MKIKFVSESKIDDIGDGPFDEFEDDSPDAKRWEILRDQVFRYLSSISHEEDAEGADGSPGFLLQDEHDNTKTMGLEFNDAKLISRPVVAQLSEIASRNASDFQISITIFVGGEMQYLIIVNGNVYVPKLKILKTLLAEE